MKAPDFSLPDQTGVVRSLNDYVGKWVMLYFYPKDNTPGCTKEACAFRDAREIIAELGNVEVIGISKDSIKSHSKFASDHNLNFTLLSDQSVDTIKAYGSWGKKKFMGREHEGILRNTYLIDPSGNIVKTYESVNPITHVKEIIKDLQTLKGAKS